MKECFQYRKPLPTKAEFIDNSSQLNIFSMNKNMVPDEATEFFIQFAKRYLLTGKSLAEICEHNSNVAKTLRKHNVSSTRHMNLAEFRSVRVLIHSTSTNFRLASYGISLNRYFRPTFLMAKKYYRVKKRKLLLQIVKKPTKKAKYLPNWLSHCRLMTNYLIC